jgi:RNA polymerase sigma factor (sigma-70 family)
MNAARPAEILRQLEQSGTPDADLLARFVARKESAAFAELVRRHGSLVFGVCRRVTGHPQDAEDAFQATFLVLAQKAGSLTNAGLLGNWLYGVAFRVAMRARRTALRRRAREVAVAVLPDPPAPEPPPAMPELAPILDEELAALSACYRDAIILCDLRGATREEAAASLGIPEGTLSSRLAVGRKKLAARLTRRGIALSAATLTLAVAEVQAAAVVTNEILMKTCALVADWTVGATVPGSLARLAQGGFFVRKTLILGAVMLAGVAGAVFAAQPGENPPPVDPPKPPVALARKPDAPPLPKVEPKPADKPVRYTSSPRLKAGWDVELSYTDRLVWSPDGTTLAVAGDEPAFEKPPARSIFYLLAYPAKPKTVDRLLTPLPKDTNFVGFTSDGKHVITDLREYTLLSGYHRVSFWDPTKGEQPAGGLWPSPGRPLVLTEGAKLRTIDFDGGDLYDYAFPSGGKVFRTIRYERDAKGEIVGLAVVEIDAHTGQTGKTLLKEEANENVTSQGGRTFSPDGQRFALMDKNFTKVTVYDLDHGKKLSEFKFPAESPPATAHGSGLVLQMVFSQDGKRLVVSRGVGQVFVVNTDTGKLFPALEGTAMAAAYPKSQAFSGDGRLVVLSGDFKEPVTKGGRPLAFAQARRSFLTVWDVETGKVLKSWPRSARVAFCPTRPILAILENHGKDTFRVGFWDFSAEVQKK